MCVRVCACAIRQFEKIPNPIKKILGPENCPKTKWKVPSLSGDNICIRASVSVSIFVHVFFPLVSLSLALSLSPFCLVSLLYPCFVSSYPCALSLMFLLSSSLVLLFGVSLFLDMFSFSMVRVLLFGLFTFLCALFIAHPNCDHVADGGRLN